MPRSDDQVAEARTAPLADSDVPEAAKAAPPCVMVIFGAGGDLTKRLVVPALYSLANTKRLSQSFQLVGVDLKSNRPRNGSKA